MPDIAMCRGNGCDLKETCYRHTASPAYRQSYFATPPIVNGQCAYHWPNKTATASVPLDSVKTTI